MEDGGRVCELLRAPGVTGIVAPMVRYSKRWGADVAFTPMIVAETFNRSQQARDVEFTTNQEDRPLVVQFAAKSSTEMASAALKVAAYTDAVDINCGCPQRWAIEEGIGSALLHDPELVSCMVKETCRVAAIPCSIKIRVDKDMRNTVEFARRAEAAGAAWIAVHGRTQRQRSHEPVDLDAIKMVKESVSIPVVANGDAFSLRDVEHIADMTGVDGVMSARGILANPALFGGYDAVPAECVAEFLRLSVSLSSEFITTHHHTMFMLGPYLNRAMRREFSALSSVAGIVDFLSVQMGVAVPRELAPRHERIK